MTILLGIFGTLSFVSISFIVLAIYLAKNPAKFKNKNEQRVRMFIENYSTTGEINSVYHQLTNNMLTQLNTPDAIYLQQLFKKLGKLVVIRDFEINDYKSDSHGEIGLFVFKAKFENADTVMNAIVIENTDSVLIDGLFLNVIGELQEVKKSGNHFYH